MLVTLNLEVGFTLLTVVLVKSELSILSVGASRQIRALVINKHFTDFLDFKSIQGLELNYALTYKLKKRRD